MTLYQNVFKLAPASEVPRPSPVPHPFSSSLTSPSCISQLSQEKKKRKRKDETKKLSKDCIGSPHNFKHLYHIGWSHQIGFADKRTSERIFEITEKQGKIEAVLEEAKTKGLLMRSSTPLHSELSSACCLKNELECQTLREGNGLKRVPTEPSFISEAQRTLQGNISSVAISSVPSMSPAMGKAQHNLILNLKEVQLDKARRDNLTLSGPQVLSCEIKKEAQLKPVVLSSLSPQHSNDGGIIAALKDVIKKRQRGMHVSAAGKLVRGFSWSTIRANIFAKDSNVTAPPRTDEESDLEKEDIWDEDAITTQEADNSLTT